MMKYPNRTKFFTKLIFASCFVVSGIGCGKQKQERFAQNYSNEIESKRCTLEKCIQQSESLLELLTQCRTQRDVTMSMAHIRDLSEEIRESWKSYRFSTERLRTFRRENKQQLEELPLEVAIKCLGELIEVNNRTSVLLEIAIELNSQCDRIVVFCDAMVVKEFRTVTDHLYPTVEPE